MRSVAVGLFCKTPTAGHSKTRLSPPLRPEECGTLSACFIRDVAATIHGLSLAGDVKPYAVYTPVGTESTLCALLPASFQLLPQCDEEFGTRLLRAVSDLLEAGHAGAILVNADSPTLPASILSAAIQAVRSGDSVVLGPALDGGYTLIGLSRPHPHVFKDIPWSTSQVHRLTVERAAEIGLPVVNLASWYDVDDGYSLRLLEAELAGEQMPFAQAGLTGAEADATRRFLHQRQALLPADSSW